MQTRHRTGGLIDYARRQNGCIQRCIARVSLPELQRHGSQIEGKEVATEEAAAFTVLGFGAPCGRREAHLTRSYTASWVAHVGLCLQHASIWLALRPRIDHTRRLETLPSSASAREKGILHLNALDASATLGLGPGLLAACSC